MGGWEYYATAVFFFLYTLVLVFFPFRHSSSFLRSLLCKMSSFSFFLFLRACGGRRYLKHAYTHVTLLHDNMSQEKICICTRAVFVCSCRVWNLNLFKCIHSC
ncbi:hypothetical protein M413DRAFT_124801 [Hebeloma cylindrosporum]|uniref:Uncharacterized protein n=1 Tax=Hebeloma cylindrosporum TaxID=76867 RepID=A0A0C3CGW3_HEBCY|nr:hypothetical protein M413DRAFT_124801 [Hebeloma cylindrosporum h7]